MLGVSDQSKMWCRLLIAEFVCQFRNDECENHVPIEAIRFISRVEDGIGVYRVGIRLGTRVYGIRMFIDT